MVDAGAAAPLELRDYLGILRRRRWLILLVTALVVGAGLAWSLTRDQVYRAQGEVVLGRQSGQSADIATEVRIVQSQAVHALATQQEPGAGSVGAAQDGTSNGITVAAESTDPSAAAATVNAHLDAYVAYRRQQAQDKYKTISTGIQTQIDALQAQINVLDAQLVQGMAAIPVPDLTDARSALINRIAAQRDPLTSQQGVLLGRLRNLQVDTAIDGEDTTVVTRATPSGTPTSPKPLQDALIALGAGLLLGIALAFVFEFLDDSIKSRSDLQRAAGDDIPVMGMIPADRSSRRAVVSLAAPQSPSAEAYRSLRTAVYFAGSDRRRRLQVTTPRSRHGKTETVVNLAVAAARAGQRVIVVDCDLRYPRVHELFGLPNQIGFTSVVRGELPLSNALQRVPGVDRVYVLASGPIPTNPAELLASERCHEVLSSLQADGTLVLIDSPPLLVADAATLARSVDGVLLVATAGVTSRKHLRQAIQLLRQIDAPLLGTVLHHADSEEAGGYSEEMGWRQRRRGRRGQPPAAARTPVLREAQEQTAIAAERSGAD